MCRRRANALSSKSPPASALTSSYPYSTNFVVTLWHLMRWLWLGWGGILLAQSLVKWDIVLDSAGKKVGDTITLTFRASIPAPYHVYSARKTEKPANFPTSFTLDDHAARGAKLVGPLLEEGKLIQTYDPIFDTKVYYYANEVKFTQRIVITDSPVRLVGMLRYQYCDEEQCFFDKVEVDYTFSVQGIASGRVADRKSSVANSPVISSAEVGKDNLLGVDSAPMPGIAGGDRSAGQVSGPVVSAAPARQASSEEHADRTAGSLWWLFLKAFFFGLAAVFTPCTFPMVPLTVSYFTKAQARQGSGFLGALWYAGSILFIFLILGGIITIFFGANATYAISTNPWLNLIFFLILVAFGLSFLGLFEITLPASWTTATSRLSNTRSLLGIFFMALTLVLVSFSCIGPLLGTLLIDMVSGSYGAPLVGMMGFGLAFALPFGLLAGVPRLLNKLPRSGSWMDTFKVTLGFLELALALKFLSNADLVWHLGILDREIYLTAWIVLFLTLGLYLFGILPLKGGRVEELSIPRLLIGMFSVGMGIYLFTGLWGAPLKAFSGFLPPIHEEMGVRVIGASHRSGSPCPLSPNRKYASLLSKHTPLGFCAFYDLEEAVAYATQVRKPILIDFTGHTCVNCRQVESSVWQDPAIQKLMQEEFVLVSLFVDDETPLDSVVVTPEGEKLRTLGDKWLYFQKAKYRIQAQPYYVITDETLVPLVPPRGFTLDKAEYKRFLEGGLGVYREKHNSL